MEQRVEILKQVLAEDVDLAIMHFTDEQHVTTYFALEAPKQCKLTERMANGETTARIVSLTEAARILLKLLQENHEVLVEDLYNFVQSLPQEERKGHPIGIVWPQSIELEKLDLNDGPLLIDTDDDEQLAWLKAEQKRRAHHRHRQWELYLQVKASIVCYQTRRKELGLWDDI